MNPEQIPYELCGCLGCHRRVAIPPARTGRRHSHEGIEGNHKTDSRRFLGRENVGQRKNEVCPRSISIRRATGTSRFYRDSTKKNSDPENLRCTLVPFFKKENIHLGKGGPGTIRPPEPNFRALKRSLVGKRRGGAAGQTSGDFAAQCLSVCGSELAIFLLWRSG